jgi:ribosomal-protein-alanine N-acetyltransferase
MPNSAITIRRMRLEDISAVVEIDRSSFSMPWTERTYRYEMLENPHAAAWVAENTSYEQPVVVGMIVAWLVVDEVHIGTIAVDARFRRLGIAKRLLATSLVDMAKRGGQAALLEVRRGNLSAQDLYEQFGFEVVGERKRYYQDNGEDALLMTLSPLDPAQLVTWLE